MWGTKEDCCLNEEFLVPVSCSLSPRYWFFRGAFLLYLKKEEENSELIYQPAS
jgi:hypothetical protein